MNYEDWYEANYHNLCEEFDIIKLQEGSEFYEFGDFVMEEWESSLENYETTLNDLWIDYSKQTPDENY